ncbi:hypothetical protein [Legionella genomosp. 1]|uniref:hypothetical protein n=1 Tax=Legionella genomosp. 1 TaxID=1093625 RepID=UPI00105475A6|nr:hypothetical protein [Legionella genomosp. 1]
MSVVRASYISLECEGKRRPFLLGCSGGGGHISAIKGIHKYLEREYAKAGIEFDFPEYEPVLLEHKGNNPSRDLILRGQGLLYDYRISPLLKKISALTPIPIIPSRESLLEETTRLNDAEKKLNRYYRDMLLDYYDAGYESAGIWNILQREDAVSELRKLIDLQKSNDDQNYSTVKERLLRDLKAAAIKGEPYTEIISTQAMGLPALCDAAREYNEWIMLNYPGYNQLVVQQYFTDLPTEGAVHFFNPLARLNKKQQQQMRLYGVGMTDEIIRFHFPKGEHFAGIYDVPAKDNPMVRPGFKNPDLDYSRYFHEPCKISLKNPDDSESDYSVAAHEQIATILLGSQAGNDTVKYIETLLTNGYEKIFVLGGHKFKKEIEEISSRYPHLSSLIIPVSTNQDDISLTPLLTRSNLVIQRGGGVSVMEGMALPHNPEQTILVHHADNGSLDETRLTSGIRWEDCNVDRLIKALSQQGIECKKTSPKLAKSQIPRARLHAALIRIENNFKAQLRDAQPVLSTHNRKQLLEKNEHLEKAIKFSASFRQSLPYLNQFIVEDFVALLSHPLIKEEPKRLLQIMSGYKRCTTKQSRANWEIVLNNLLSEDRLTHSWLNKLSHPELAEPVITKEVLRSIILRMLELQQSLSDKELHIATKLSLSIVERASLNDLKGLKQLLSSAVPPKGTTNDNLKKYYALCNCLAERLQTRSDVQELNYLLLNPKPGTKSRGGSLIGEHGEPKTRLLSSAGQLEDALKVYILGMKSDLNNYKKNQFRFFSPRYMVHYNLMHEKLNIAETLLTNLTRLNQKELPEQTRAKLMAKMLVTAQKVNEKVVDRAFFASSGRLGELLNSHVGFMKHNYSIAYHQGCVELHSKTFTTSSGLH